MEVENNTPNGDEFFKKNAAIITTIFLPILSIFSLLWQNGGEVIPQADLEINLAMILIIYFLSSIAIAGIMPLLVSMLIYILKLAYMLDLPQKKLHVLFIQNALFSIVPGFIFSSAIYIFFKYEMFWGGLIIPPIIVVATVLLVKNMPFSKDLLNTRQVKTDWTGIIVVQLIGIIIFAGVNHFNKPHIYPPKIEWERDYYSSKDNRVIVKIKGIHSVNDAKLTKAGVSQIIPVQYYYVDSNTYLVIDFAVDFVIEGNYLFKAIIGETPVEHTLLYVINRSLEDKEKYIDAILGKIYNLNEKNKDPRNKEQLDLIRQAYLNGNTVEVSRIFNSLKGHLSSEAIILLSKVAI